MKLISATEFILEIQSKFTKPLASYQDAWCYIACKNYANFLKQPLTLGMFVPCKPNGKKMTDPSVVACQELLEYDESDYQQAKERVFFEGVDAKTAKQIMVLCNTVEEAVYKFDFERELTPTALKQIGINQD
jgi:hypothetical protein